MAAFAFDFITIDVLAALAELENWASRRVMERLGMRIRGMERWYDMELAAYSIARSDWEQDHTRPHTGPEIG